MTEWISVEDKSPEDDQVVLGYCPKQDFVEMVYYYRNKFQLHGYFQLKVEPTHWMPLPDPPSVQEKENE
jgi:hypothetical protein